jgi:quercetin dioxygenase-like cupin family protein
MTSPHFFDPRASAWTEHPQFSGLFIKVLESRATHPGASVTLTRLAVGKSIGTHVHAVETETAYLLVGSARLCWNESETILEAGSGVTIPPGIHHSLHNVGDSEIELIAIHVPPVR